MVARQLERAAPPSNKPSLANAPILPRRILFHPAFRSSSSSSSASSFPLIPLNSPPIDPPSSRNGDQAAPMHPELPLRRSQPSQSLQSTPVQRIGAGLANLGNTCFLNSVLQCLTYTPPLAAYLQSGLHRTSCRMAGFCAMCALESHVTQTLPMSGRIVSPTYLVKNLRCISRSFQMWRQEDAHEYMRYFIEALQKCSSSVQSSGGASSGSQESFIHKIFGGRLRSQVKCTQCSHCSNTYDPFLDLSLEIVRAESLLKALARFTAVEVLDGVNKYQCSKCKAKVRALKQFTIDKVPHILTVQFKRFSSTGGFGGKIDKKVHFDRTLDIKPFVSGGEDEELKYSLYAVLVHSGWSTHSGHYYCFVRTASDMWHVLDDNRVSQVSEKAVLEQKAYILFYVRNRTVSISDSAKCGSGGGKIFSNKAMLQENSSSRLNGVASVHAAPEAIVTQGTNGDFKTSLHVPNGTGYSDRLSNSTTTKVNVNLRVEPYKTQKMEPACSSQPTVDAAKSQQQLVHASACAHATCCDVASAHLPKKDDNGYLQNGQRTGVANGLLPVPDLKSKLSKENRSPFPGLAAPAAGRTDLFDVAVPRWSEVDGCQKDEMEVLKPPDETKAPSGYVLDEWDKEYDRGKIKKVRKKSLGKQMEDASSAGKSEASVHGNLFQALAGSKLRVVNHRLKNKKRQCALGYKMFLKKHLFKHL